MSSGAKKPTITTDCPCGPGYMMIHLDDFKLRTIVLNVRFPDGSQAWAGNYEPDDTGHADVVYRDAIDPGTYTILGIQSQSPGKTNYITVAETTAVVMG